VSDWLTIGLIIIFLVALAVWVHQVEIQADALCRENGYDSGGWYGRVWCTKGTRVDWFPVDYVIVEKERLE
jgi:hypothetical protein